MDNNIKYTVEFQPIRNKVNYSYLKNIQNTLFPSDDNISISTNDGALIISIHDLNSYDLSNILKYISEDKKCYEKSVNVKYNIGSNEKEIPLPKIE